MCFTDGHCNIDNNLLVFVNHRPVFGLQSERFIRAFAALGAKREKKTKSKDSKQIVISPEELSKQLAQFGMSLLSNHFFVYVLVKMESVYV